jgi:hypothetical protein
MAQPNRLMNTPLIQKGAVTAAQIDKPECAGSLRMNDRMQAGNLCRLQHDGIQRRSPN